MTNIKVAICPHPDAGRRGEAIMQLNGLWLLPSESTYSIDALEGEDDGETDDGWPVGDHVPLEPRLVSTGVEFTIASNILDAAALKPGTPVIVSIPLVGVRAELRWPNLPAAVANGAGQSVMTLSQRNSAVEARKAQLAAEVAEVRARDAKLLAETAAATRALEAELLAIDEAENSASKEALSAPLLEQDKDPESASETLAVTETSGTRETPVIEIVAPPVAISGPSKKDMELPDVPVATRPSTSPSVPAAQRIAQMGNATIVSTPVTPRRWGHLAGAAAVSAAAAFALVIWPGSPAKVLKTGAQNKTAMTRPSLAIPLRDVFSPGLVSPLGKSSKSIAVDTALQLADAYLHGDGVPQNSEEASYWLRHSLRNFSDDPRLAWALTQLGAIYAQTPSGPADYDRAAALWEIAAARNDPVAHCFLAALHEQGLASSSSKDSALSLYRDAKRLGGCPNVDQAIERLSR